MNRQTPSLRRPGSAVVRRRRNGRLRDIWRCKSARWRRCALDCILDPSFVDTSWRGELLTKAEALSALPKRTSSTLELSAIQPKLIGDAAIMRGIDTHKSAGRIIGSLRFVDVFVYRSGRWQAVSAQETLIATSP